MRTYTTIGSVRGTCGHNHRTIAAAYRCCQRDHNACAGLGGGAYSDRYIVVGCPGDGPDELTEHETRAVLVEQEGRLYR